VIEMEAFSQNGSRYISFREMPDVSGRYKLRKAIPMFGGRVENALGYKTTNDFGSRSQHGCRLPIVEESFGRHFDVQHRAILAQIIGREEVTSDPTESFGVRDRDETSINDSSDDGGKTRIATKVVLQSMA
jgi:hypothetical protein